MFRISCFQAAKALICVGSWIACGGSTLHSDERLQEVVNAISQNRTFVVAGEFTGTAPDRSIHFEIRSGLRLVSTGTMNVGSLNGLRAYISNDGKHIVLCNENVGLTIYASDGTELSNYDGNQLLSRRERDCRPGATGCHPEGNWCQDTNPVTFVTDNLVRVTLHSGRTIDFELQSGRIGRVGEEYLAADEFNYSLWLMVAVVIGIFRLGILGWNHFQGLRTGNSQ